MDNCAFRTTRRVQAPPGGISSLSLSWDEDSSCKSGIRAEESRCGSNGRGCPTRGSSNLFASRSNQNCGNVITDTPSTRVHAPPGGSSSVSLAWEEASSCSTSKESQSVAYDSRSYASSTYSRGSRADTSTRRHPRYDMERSSMPCINEDVDMSVGDSAFSRFRGEVDTASYAASRRSCRDSEGTSQASSVRNDRCRSSSEASFQPRPRASSNAYACGSQQNSGNVLTETPTTRVNAPPGGASSLSLGDTESRVDPDKLRMLKAGISRKRTEKAEVEGSRPRLHKPEIRVHAPPGGISSISHDMTVDAARITNNRKHFPEAGGVGNNRDSFAINELRYFQENCGGVGKQHIQERHLRASQRDCEHQRYHLDSGDKFERVPRRAQCKQDVDSKTLPIFSPSCGSSQTTCLGSDEYGESHFDVNSVVSSEIDDLPLGAEWCTWRHGECCNAY